MCCWATAAVGNSAKQRRGGPIRPRFPGNSRQAVVSPDTLGNGGQLVRRSPDTPPPKNARKNAHDGGVVYGLQPVQKIGPPPAMRRAVGAVVLAHKKTERVPVGAPLDAAPERTRRLAAQ